MGGLGGGLAGCLTGKWEKRREERRQGAGEKSRRRTGSNDWGETSKGRASEAFVNRTGHGLMLLALPRHMPPLCPQTFCRVHIMPKSEFLWRSNDASEFSILEQGSVQTERPSKRELI